MRPFVLDPLFRPLTTLPGVGPKNAKLLAKLVGGESVFHLLSHLPVDVIDRRFAPPLNKVPNGKIVTLQVTADKHIPNERKSKPYRVKCSDPTGEITLVFFHARKDWIEKQLPEGGTVFISGRAEYFNGVLQMTHPDYILPPSRRDEIEDYEPIYPLTQGVTNKTLRKAITAALETLKPLPEWLDPAHQKRQQWPAWLEALTRAHTPTPQDIQTIMEGTALPHRQRLAYDELLANQLTLALVRSQNKKKAGRAFQCAGALRDQFLANLPFQLTNAQKNALDDVDQDMSAPTRMLRLIQGDVGSGKTVVGTLAMLNALQSGAQAALMAPTEILARQHEENLRGWLEPLGIRVIALTGRDKGKAREVLLQQIRSGAAQVVIGTHALFQTSIIFDNLGIAVIDEQHRFGVHQRLALSEKGKGTDILVMTATPIPRTLALTTYGDMDISLITEKPPGRKPIDTRLFPNDKLEQIIAGLHRQIKTGARAYWVCPLVEDSEVLDLAAAEERYDILKAEFGERVGLMHGRMKPQEKDAVMSAFATGDLDILVSTTVIEVGVNVPEATIMVIEHAERFGLAQLHQLRGRVGRGGEKSYCFLLYAAPLSETGKERLTTMRDTEDGFIIAEKDLQLRGSGDILGVQQSGMLNFRFALLSRDGDLLKTASDDARLILEKDMLNTGERGDPLRTLLYLFERDRAIGYLKAG